VNIVLNYLILEWGNTVSSHLIPDRAYEVINLSKLDWANKVLNRLPNWVNIVLGYLILDLVNTVPGYIIQIGRIKFSIIPSQIGQIKFLVDSQIERI